ncbi:MAG: 4'-phosphopantetheinyl transferase superfamily protein [Oscillospiraceae bacterium]|nr:4'-phosphopantetheinyl transferase superfamily protein [Oscillospiraceae bacterium]
MTTVYFLDLRPYDNGRWKELLPLLPQERQERISACRQEEDKLRLAGAGAVLHRALREAGIASHACVFEANPWGKPFLKGREDIHFSLSHSGHWAACAISDAAVGVDVELPRCTMKLAKRHFHPDELEQLSTLDEAARADALNRLWTAKEAFLKMLGRGLTVPLDSFTVSLAEPPILRQGYTKLPYGLHEYRLEDSRACLCCCDAAVQTKFYDL